MKEVSPGIFMITEKESGKIVKFSVNAFVIAGKDGIVFDAGCGMRRSRRYLIRQIREIESLMRQRGQPCTITRAIASHGHWDHFSGLKYLQKTLKINILSTRKMYKSIGSKRHYRISYNGDNDIAIAPLPKPLAFLNSIKGFLISQLWFKIFGVAFIEKEVQFIEEEAVLTVNGENWEVISAPGHCDDDIVLFNRQRGILLAGDTILRTVTTWLSPPRSHMQTYIETLERLAALPGLKLILAAHGSPITTPYERLNQAIEYRKKRTVDVLDVIKKKGAQGISFEGLFQTFYPGATFFNRFVVQGWILSTLEYLLETEQIASMIKGRQKIFMVR